MGFDHVALALGAGKPTLLSIPGGLARGVRMASDFLMALQLTGAAKQDSIANLQLRLPSVVIGGGLTAIDTATEAMAYYPVQVEKFLKRYETLVAEHGAEGVRAQVLRASSWKWPTSSSPMPRRSAPSARAPPRPAKRPKLSKLIDGWGGVTIAYRRRLIDSPSYTLNHEEVEKAMEEGIRFAEGLTPDAHRPGCDRPCRAHPFQERGGRRRARCRRAPCWWRRARGPNTVLAREDARELQGRRPVFPGARTTRARW